MAERPARFTVLITAGAASDLASIHRYRLEHEGAASADRLFDQLTSMIDDLARLPQRGSVPRELAGLGIQVFRQIVSAPYRVVYRISGRDVIIHLVADGRRDMAALLERRLLGG